MCLANTADKGYQSHNDADEELQRSIVVQQLDGVVDDVALQRSSAASSFSSLLVSWMAHKSTAKVETCLSRKTPEQARGSLSARIPPLIPFLLLFHSSGRLRHHKNEFIATEKCVLCENTTKLASEQRRRRYRSWQTSVVDLCFEMTQSELVATDRCVLSESSTRLASTERRPGYGGSHRTASRDF